MSIQIKQRGINKWRIVLRDEEWEFDTLEEMKEMLNKLFDFKIKYGGKVNEND